MRNNVITHHAREIKRYWVDYLLLVAMSAISLTGIWYYKGAHETQLAFTTLFALSYMFWGLLHHIKDKTFHTKVISEYILIGALVIILSRLILG